MGHRLVLRSSFAVAAATLLGGAVVAVPASAATNQVTACNTVITSGGHWVLASDLTCPAAASPSQLDPAIVIRHNGVTLSLNGHTLTGGDTANHTSTEQVGVLFANVKGAKLVGPGTVTAFDGGVAILGGTQNSVSGVTTHDNINHVLFPMGGAADSSGLYGDPAVEPCNYGDGILTDNSTYNVISGNTTYHNGPYSGIALVDASSNNTVTGNTSYNQSVYNVVPYMPWDTSGGNGPCGPFSANIAGVGRPDQDIGIRVEGPGATNNLVSDNNSHNNMLEGISLHGHVCATHTSSPPAPTADNSGNTVANNTVTNNGNDADAPGSPNGIGILEQGPAGTVCPSDHETITGNTSTGNAHDGIYAAGRDSNNNVITNNTVTGNGSTTYPGNGIELDATNGYISGTTLTTVSGNQVGGNTNDGILLKVGASNNTLSGNSGTGNTHFDAEDQNPACDSNSWSGDSFGTVSQSCIS